MSDKMNFQPEAFPLEVLTGQSADSSEFVFEGDELEEERRGGAPFRQGVSARRWVPPSQGRAAACAATGGPVDCDRQAATSRPDVAWPGGDGVTSGRSGSEHMRWTQDCLNRAISATLPVDGTMSPAIRSAFGASSSNRGSRRPESWGRIPKTR